MTRSRIRAFLRRGAQITWETIRRYFVAGLLAFAPIAITLWAMAWIIGRLDNLLLPRVLDFFIPGRDGPVEVPPLVGALFTFVVILLAGVVVRHLFGHELVRLSERMLRRVPIARSIYGGVKQLFEAIFQPNRKDSFNRVVVIEYPRKGLFALAFTTGQARGAVADAIGEPLMNCFVPTTPNPTSGFYLLVRPDEIIDVDISVEDAFKVIMSAGLVVPGEPGQAIAPPPELAPAARTAAGESG